MSPGAACRGTRRSRMRRTARANSSACPESSRTERSHARCQHPPTHDASKASDTVTDLTHLTAHELTDAYASGATTPSAVADAHLARIAAVDGRVRAYLTV